jgi:hypothetical protein
MAIRFSLQNMASCRSPILLQPNCPDVIFCGQKINLEGGGFLNEAGNIHIKLKFIL